MKKLINLILVCLVSKEQYIGKYFFKKNKKLLIHKKLLNYFLIYSSAYIYNNS